MEEKINPFELKIKSTLTGGFFFCQKLYIALHSWNNLVLILFSFGIETSANINTNPRTENGCITINKEIYNFYKEYFDGIISFEKWDVKR